MTATSAFHEQRTHDAQRLPRHRDVLLEQFRAIGFALRIPMLIAAALAVVATLAMAIQIASGDITGNLLAEPSAFPGGVGVLLPIAVWAREERFGPGFLWTLPVDRSHHALIKVLAGWLWLMIGIALYASCLLVLALVSGSGVLPVETLHVLTTELPRSAPVDPAALRTVQFAPGPMIWLVPFGAATATYLFASAFMLGVRRPLRWAVAAALLFPISSFVAHVSSRLLGKQWLADAPERAVGQLCEGRFGLDSLLKLRTWTLDRRAFLTNGEPITVWTAVPDLADWRIAFVLWTAAGLLVLWLAVSRHREQRRD